MASGPVLDQATLASVGTYLGRAEYLTGNVTKYRMYRRTGIPAADVGSWSLAGSGQDIDAVGSPVPGDVDGSGAWNYAGTNTRLLILALPGIPVKVVAGAAFASGATLQSDSAGGAITKTTGVGVLVALEAASAAGDVVWAKCTSGR